MIIWLVYFALVIYNILDVYQSLLLFDCGYTEWNPIILYLINAMGPIYGILFLKLFFLSSLGLLIIARGRTK